MGGLRRCFAAFGVWAFPSWLLPEESAETHLERPRPPECRLREPRPARFPPVFYVLVIHQEHPPKQPHDIRYISTSHHTTDQGPHIQAPCCRNFAGLLTAPRTQSRTPHPGRLRSCRRGQLCQPALTRVELRGLVVGLPRPWPSSCHRPASLATPVGVGRPPRELRRRAGGSA